MTIVPWYRSWFGNFRWRISLWAIKSKALQNPDPLKTERVGHPTRKSEPPRSKHGHPALTYWSGIIEACAYVKRKTRKGAPPAPRSGNARERLALGKGGGVPALTHEDTSGRSKQGKTWSACPNCGANLDTMINGVRRLYTECPVCDTQIIYVWWQRVLCVLLGFFLSWLIPEALGLRGWTVFFLMPILLLPSFVLAMHLLFPVMPLKYVRRREHTLTLFHK
jgi:hypothetical protein